MATLRNAVRVPKKAPPGLLAALAAGLCTLAICAALVAAGFALWVVVGIARDGWFHQITLYPALCQDARCETWQALPRIRYRVEIGTGEVYFWPIIGGFEADSASGGLFRLSNCTIFDRGTWTCWAKGRSDVVSFYDGQPARIEILPFESGLISLKQEPTRTVRYLDRMDWYLSQYAPRLLSRR